ncbi:MAG: glycosyltransferase family 1 protein [Candidatus Omnitrophota bacterium]
MRTIQIVPSLPPVINGLGDYAFCVAEALRKEHGVDTDFIVTDSAWEPAATEAYPVKKIKRDKAKLIAELNANPAPVILHYVGYGYAKRGCPFWLLEALSEWKKKTPDRKLITVFHELYATGPVYSSAFWLSPLQKKLASRLIELSDSCVTSKKSYADRISQLSKGKHINIPALPVFSNIGEPLKISLLSQRKPCMVVFGSEANRKRVYIECFKKLSCACKALGIKELFDIGPIKDFNPPAIEGVAIKPMGMLTADKASAIMSESLAGFLSYHPYFLGKSGIFAAYCAHGLLPINAGSSKEEVDGLKAGENYWHIDSRETLDLINAQAIADNAYKWYKQHKLSVHAQVFSDILKKYRT